MESSVEAAPAIEPAAPVPTTEQIQLAQWVVENHDKVTALLLTRANQILAAAIG